MNDRPLPPAPKRVAIVIPWFGRELRGGAEQHAWELAVRLAARGHLIEVLTTCCRAHQDDWSKNYYKPGITSEPEGFLVRRFPVVDRDPNSFDRVNARLMTIPRHQLVRGVSPLTEQEEEIFVDELMRSPSLLDFVRTEAHVYPTFLFLPYLYFSTLRGVPLVADRAILVPCLHHESYAFLPTVAEAFFKARRILYLADGESELAQWLFGPGIVPKGSVAGAGVHFAPVGPTGITDDVKALQPYVLCLGRQDPGKNTQFLTQAFVEFSRRNPGSQLRFVLAGPGTISLPDDCPRVVNRGLVSEEQKAALLAGCTALFAPSANESYSRVLMEAWYHQRPAVVHSDCLATAVAVQRSGGGWTAGSAEEWIDAFLRVERTPAGELDSVGALGNRHLKEVASWESAITRYETAIEQISEEPTRTAPPNRCAVHQVLSNLAYGDAISNEAIWIRQALRQSGYASEIYALDVHELVRGEAQSWTEGCLSATDAIIYHHSIGSAVTTHVCRHTGPKAVIYHNITPHQFFTPFLPLHERLCREGREHLPELPQHFAASTGDSAFNAIELAEHGFAEPSILPLCIDPEKWQMHFDAASMRQLQDGRTNILFVGRLCPNKRQEHLIAAFAHYVAIEPTARLHLVGTAVTPNDAYEACLRRVVSELGLEDKVDFAGHVDDAQLAAYYASAHLFWSMSEHEGFCIPLVEAMWFDVPVFAFGVSAVPETLGTAGEQFTGKDDLATLARTAHALIHDTKTRREVIARQRERRTAFLPEKVRAKLLKFVHDFVHHGSDLPPPAAATMNPASVHEIAVVAVGDAVAVLQATPVLFGLRRHFPDARLTLIASAECAEIIQGNPDVDRIVSFDAPWLRAERAFFAERSRAGAESQTWISALGTCQFDLVINLGVDEQSLLFAASIPNRDLLSFVTTTRFAHLPTIPLMYKRSDSHISVRNRELLGLINAHSLNPPSIYLSDADYEFPEVLRALPQPVFLAPGATDPLDRWPTVMFRELTRRLCTSKQDVVLIGSIEDRRLTEEWESEFGCVNLCGMLSLRQIAACLSRASCLVANNGPYLHVGAAVGIPVVGILRPPALLAFAPSGTNHVMCARETCPVCGDSHGLALSAPTRTACACIRSISIDQVESGVRRAMVCRQIASSPGEPGADEAIRRQVRVNGEHQQLPDAAHDVKDKPSSTSIANATAIASPERPDLSHRS